jgi:hypothetical protein
VLVHAYVGHAQTSSGAITPVTILLVEIASKLPAKAAPQYTITTGSTETRVKQQPSFYD